ncbi:MAG TPA: cellulase family glycosylhydrolase, partial [Solirubrobacteraceae bacterium]|nr:cellulase family glycosylhydrolase [Solirubrobacteraceae bacterium]
MPLITSRSGRGPALPRPAGPVPGLTAALARGLRLGLAAVAAACLVALALPAARASAASPAISVQSNQLMRNGVPWVPRGVQIVGLVAPDGALNGKYIPAHQHFSAAELQAAVADHADVVRFQVSQFGIDPQGPLYSPAYVQEVQNGIEAARALGLAVIVSVQAEGPAGEMNRCPLPDSGAARAWAQLAPMFAGDPGVMFELYNEPAPPPTQVDWDRWLNGGQVSFPSGSCQSVGMQPLIDQIRAVAPQNVIVVPGLRGEQTLRGMPQVTDPANPDDPQLAYGIHYPTLVKNIGAWDTAFGAVTARAPVIVTEWDANSTTNCLVNAPLEAQLLLDYLASKQIGIVGFAFDLPGTIIADWSYTPTSYSAFACGAYGGGPGQLLFSDFAAEAQAGDGSQPNPAPGWIVSAGALNRLHQLAPGLTGHFFNTPRTFVSGASTQSLAATGLQTAIPTETFTNEVGLARALNAGRLRPGTEAVVYADSASRRTPRNQQRNPGRFYRLAARAAHVHGLLFIAAPSPSLVSVITPHTPPARQTQEFLKLRIPAAAARNADAYE